MASWMASEPSGHTLVEGASGCALAVPTALHAQLFLLAYDRHRHRVAENDTGPFTS
jgi:hypothetical protein